MEKSVYIYAHWNQYSKEFDHQISTYERSPAQGDVLLETRQIEFNTVNDRELRTRMAAALQLKLRNTMAEHQKEETEIQESINEMLSIEYKPSNIDAEGRDDDIPF